MGKHGKKSDDGSVSDKFCDKCGERNLPTAVRCHACNRKLPDLKGTGLRHIPKRTPKHKKKDK